LLAGFQKRRQDTLHLRQRLEFAADGSQFVLDVVAHEGAGRGIVAAQIEELATFLQAEAQDLGVFDEADAMHDVTGIAADAHARFARLGDQTLALVEADGLYVHARTPGRLADTEPAASRRAWCGAARFSVHGLLSRRSRRVPRHLW
jgi:hypothetical protein